MALAALAALRGEGKKKSPKKKHASPKFLAQKKKVTKSEK
jgi:hypothetical protein